MKYEMKYLKMKFFLNSFIGIHSDIFYDFIFRHYLNCWILSYSETNVSVLFAFVFASFWLAWQHWNLHHSPSLADWCFCSPMCPAVAAEEFETDNPFCSRERPLLWLMIPSRVCPRTLVTIS